MWFMTPSMLTVEKQNTVFLFKIILLILLMYEVHGHSLQRYKEHNRKHTRSILAEKPTNPSGNVNAYVKPLNEEGVHEVREFNDASFIESGKESNSEIVTLDHEIKVRSVLGPVPICENATFCEDTPEYPTEIVNKMIEKNPYLLNYAYVDGIKYFTQKADIPDEEPLCISAERVVYPKSAETMNSTWLFVVNQSNFTQGVRIETCVEEDSSCKVIDGFAQGYVTACKQKYIYRQLSAIASDGSITREFFRFPASCCCHVKFVGETSISKAAPLLKKPQISQYRSNNSYLLLR